MSITATIALSCLAGLYLGGILTSLFIGLLHLDSGRFWANARTGYADLQDEWHDRARTERASGLRRIYLAPLWPVDAYRYVTTLLNEARRGVDA